MVWTAGVWTKYFFAKVHNQTTEVSVYAKTLGKCCLKLCITSASSIALTMRVPSNERPSRKTFWPLMTKADLWETEELSCTFSLTLLKLRPQRGLQVMRGQTSTSCPLKVSTTGSAICAPAWKEGGKGVCWAGTQKNWELGQRASHQSNMLVESPFSK